jgi:hypothetical protein
MDQYAWGLTALSGNRHPIPMMAMGSGARGFWRESCSNSARFAGESDATW